MDTKDKSRGNWTTPIEEIFIKNGLKPIEIKKTGSVVIIPERKPMKLNDEKEK